MKQNLHSVWKCWVLSIAVVCTYLPSISQTYGEKSSFFEAGITVGPSNFLGDLGGNAGKGTTFVKDNNFSMTKLTFGGFLTYQPNDWLGVRLALNFGKLEGDDAIIKGKGGYEEARKARNSNFRSKFTEVLLLGEFYPTVFLEDDPSDTWLKLRPYVVAGIGYFKFNPQGTDPVTGNWVDLQPLHTEGQGFVAGKENYKLTQMNVPLGIGVKYYLSETVHLGLELIHRKTFTDYIDDVSTTYVDPALFYANLPLQTAQLAARLANKSGGTGNLYKPGSKRGTATNNDAYYTFGVKLGFRLGSSDRYGTSTRCPVRF